jgi:surface carbohydrate biosynthesis protein (TIGR04326 family)
MSATGARFLLTDAVEDSEDGDVLLLAWNDHTEGPRRLSVARHLDVRASAIRAKYLAFVCDLGRSGAPGATLIERLARHDGYNLWWSSSIAEKSPFKSAAIIDCLKLLALEEILIERRPALLRIRLGGPRATAVAVLARRLGISVRREGSRREWPGAKALFRALPAVLQAGVWVVRHLLPRLVLRRARGVPWYTGPRAVTFFSYFFNISEAAFRRGEFRPAQWGDLPQFCTSSGLRMNFAHHFLPTPPAPRPADALRWVRRFNENADAQGAHTFVDSYVGGRELWRATRAYLRAAVRSFTLGDVRAAFSPQGSAVSLWPLLKHDWLESVRGRVAFQSCIWMEAFDAMLRELPRQQLGLYLQENQGWERILIHAWRRHGHGALVGVAHSTVRFWDLRYFDDPREYQGAAALERPAPDEVALNGAVAERMYAEAGYPRRTVGVEALRFMHLAGLAGRAARAPSSRPTLLVAGDSVRAATGELLRCLAAVPRGTRAAYRILFKPHPWCPIELTDFGLDDVESRAESIPQLIGEADLVCGGISSVTLEGYCAGVPVIVFVAPGSLNFSPVLGLEGARMANGPAEMGASLGHPVSAAPAARPELFHLDGRFPRWRKLLRSHGIEMPMDQAA